MTPLVCIVAPLYQIRCEIKQTHLLQVTDIDIIVNLNKIDIVDIHINTTNTNEYAVIDDHDHKT